MTVFFTLYKLYLTRILNSNTDIEFIGFVSTNIVYSSKRQRWELMNYMTKNVIAYMNETSDYPIGSHSWYFTQSSCVDDGENYRKLNFRKYVRQPGMFCCNDGGCFSSEVVNDGVKHCESGEDESDYPMLMLPQYYDRLVPPDEVSVNLNIIDIPRIDVADSYFDVYFSMSLKWYDKKLRFQYLKNNDEENTVSEKDELQIWIPKLNFALGMHLKLQNTKLGNSSPIANPFL